jgi:hypothetical protein
MISFEEEIRWARTHPAYWIAEMEDFNWAYSEEVDKAANWLAGLYHLGAVSAKPNLSMNYDGEISAEWWKEDRKIIVYFIDNNLIKVWGVNIDTEMEDIDAQDWPLVIKAFTWLKGESV